jgi:predicted transposase YbfD/YdcC
MDDNTLKEMKQLYESFKNIKDFRTRQKSIKYPLAQVLFMSLIGMIKGNVTYDDLSTWMHFCTESNKIFKSVFNKIKVNVPSRSTLHEILVNIDNNALEEIFREYFIKYCKLENIAVDGKWLNGSDIDGQYTNESHKSIFNIFDKDIKIVFAHKFLEKGKLSEIPAFNEVLEGRELSGEGQIYSFDALLTQSKSINLINDSKSKYVAKVKENQGSLKQQVLDVADQFENPSETFSDELRVENNKYVNRTVELFYSNSCDIVMFHNAFKNIQTIIKITKTATDPKQNLKQMVSTQYLIANFKTSAKRFAEIIRFHWRIETYHYHLDNLTKEDDHIAYIAPFSISVLRSFVVNLYQLYLNENSDKRVMRSRKVTMANIKKCCVYDDDFVVGLFGL